MKYSININQKQYEVEVGAINGNIAQVVVNGACYDVQVEKQGIQADAQVVNPVLKPVTASMPKPKPSSAPSLTGSGTITAPIPGLIKEVTVKVGDAVKSGQVVVVMEAMKMENRLITTVDGKVTEIRVQNGGQVATGDVILIIG